MKFLRLIRWRLCWEAGPSLPNPTPRCGRRSGLARHGGDELYVADTGSRLTTSFGYRGGKPLRHPISPPPNPRTRLSSVATIANRVSFRHRKCHAFGCYASLLTAFRKRIKSASLHRVSGQQAALTPDDFPLCQTQCSTGRSVTPMVRQGHTQCSNRLVLHYRSLKAHCSRCALGLSVG